MNRHHHWRRTIIMVVLVAWNEVKTEGHLNIRFVSLHPAIARDFSKTSTWFGDCATSEKHSPLHFDRITIKFAPLQLSRLSAEFVCSWVNTTQPASSNVKRTLHFYRMREFRKRGFNPKFWFHGYNFPLSLNLWGARLEHRQVQVVFIWVAVRTERPEAINRWKRVQLERVYRALSRLLTLIGKYKETWKSRQM